MSRAGKGKTRSYWGCTTFGCELGFNGTEEALPEDLSVCPACDGDLTTITVTKRNPDPAPAPAPVQEASSPEVLAQLERRARGERMFQLCRARIIEHYPSLWPGEIIGASIGDQWIRNVARRMRTGVTEAHRTRAAAAGIVLPS